MICIVLWNQVIYGRLSIYPGLIKNGDQILMYEVDLLIYTIEDQAERTLMPLQNITDRVMTWLHHWKVYVSPEKYNALNFSHRCTPNAQLRTKIHSIPWTR